MVKLSIEVEAPATVHVERGGCAVHVERGGWRQTQHS